MAENQYLSPFRPGVGWAVCGRVCVCVCVCGVDHHEGDQGGGGGCCETARHRGKTKDMFQIRKIQLVI